MDTKDVSIQQGLLSPKIKWCVCRTVVLRWCQNWPFFWRASLFCSFLSTAEGPNLKIQDQFIHVDTLWRQICGAHQMKPIVEKNAIIYYIENLSTCHNIYCAVGQHNISQIDIYYSMKYASPWTTINVSRGVTTKRLASLCLQFGNTTCVVQHVNVLEGKERWRGANSIGSTLNQKQNDISPVNSLSIHGRCYLIK